jgi:hypothetical protein
MVLHLSGVTPNIVPGLSGSIIVINSSRATAAAAARPSHGGGKRNSRAGQHNNQMAQCHAHAIGDLTMEWFFGLSGYVLGPRRTILA